MAYNPIPISDSVNPTNPNVGYSVEPSATGDWYVHLQTVDLMYIRRNVQDHVTSSVVAAPTTTSNYLDVQAVVQTQDEVHYDVAFSSLDGSGELFQSQTLQIQTDNVSGGFGEKGSVSTSAMGIIRRKVRKDAQGNILDPTGICTESVSLVLDQMPGAYDESFDTSATVNGILAQAMGQLAESCPEFKATLVDL